MTLKPTEGQEFSGARCRPGGRAAAGIVLDLPGPGGATVSSGALHVDGGFARPTPPTAQDARSSSPPPSAPPGFRARRLRGGLQQRSQLGDLQRHAARPAALHRPTPAAAPPTHQYAASEHTTRLPAPLPDPVGRRPGPFYVDGNRPGAHRHRQLRTPTRCARSPATSTPAAARSSVDWLHLSPYPASGTFLSRVFDAGQAADWGALSWHANAPPTPAFRSTSAPATRPPRTGRWSAFTPINSSGGDIPGNTRYVQYQAVLGSSDANQTPTLSDVSIAYTTGAPTPPRRRSPAAPRRRTPPTSHGTPTWTSSSASR